MGLSKPYRRTVRQFFDGSFTSSDRAAYIRDPRYCSSPVPYIRAFLLLQKDLIELFDWVEPSDINGSCYSFRIHELFIRTCIEIEANFKAIFEDNGFYHEKPNINVYRKIQHSHYLSNYEVIIPQWSGPNQRRVPFLNWKIEKSKIERDYTLEWYQNYNKIKHQRVSNFSCANLNSLLDAFSGLIALLSAQFLQEDFSSSFSYLVADGPNDEFKSAIGDIFRVKYGQIDDLNQRYDFNTLHILSCDDAFECYDYSKI